jgi:hypothetical protein
MTGVALATFRNSPQPALATRNLKLSVDIFNADKEEGVFLRL